MADDSLAVVLLVLSCCVHSLSYTQHAVSWIGGGCFARCTDTLQGRFGAQGCFFVEIWCVCLLGGERLHEDRAVVSVSASVVIYVCVCVHG